MKNTIKSLKFNDLFCLIACVFMTVYSEVVLHIFVYGELPTKIIYTVMFACAVGLLVYALCTFFRDGANRVIVLTVNTLITLYFETQLVYNSIFSEFMSVWQVNTGADAVTNFWRQMLYAVFKAKWKILVLLLPLIALYILVLKKKLVFERKKPLIGAFSVVLCVCLHFSCIGLMYMRSNSRYSVYNLYRDSATPTETSVKNIGLISTARLELKNIIFGSGTDSVFSGRMTDKPVKIDDSKKYNMLDIDFKKLSDGTNDKKLSELDEYLSTLYPTSKNEYTGIFSDCNLIALCAESFSPYFISEELTPALYKLTHGGIVFKNYYGSFSNNTTNGEYTFCMGLFPDLTRKKSIASMYASQNNYLPFCYGNIFKTEGVTSYAYHNYNGSYYNRDSTHPNMGYIFKSADNGLDMSMQWPASDLEMMQKSVDDYIDGGQRFCAYYMTFSGHYQYDWKNNMSAKNREKVEELNYSEEVKAYIACNLELEYALEYLLDRLDAAGISDNTVIVLTNDHYPYGLTDDEYNELAGKKVDRRFEMYRNSFICYSPRLTKEVDTYCSTIDILPTVLNLFGFDYDSRLIAGKDVLSPEARDMAIISDGSIITRDYAYSTKDDILVSFDGDSKRDYKSLSDTFDEVTRIFELSTGILNTDYYAHVFLGSQSSGELFNKYSYDDIPNTIDLTALRYVVDNGYMDAESDKIFGFANFENMPFLLETLYRMSGKPEYTLPPDTPEFSVDEKYRSAVEWALSAGLIVTTDLEGISDTQILRGLFARTVYRYEKYRGYDVSVSDETEEGLIDREELFEKYPGIDDETLSAIIWAFNKKILVGTGEFESVIISRNEPMTKYTVMLALFKESKYIDA